MAILLLIAGSGTWAEAQNPATATIDVSDLLAAIRVGPQGARDRAAQRLYHLQDPSANAALVAMADDPTEQTRAIALWAIAIVRPQGAANVVLSRLEDRCPAVRAGAAVATGALRMARSERKLARLVNDPAEQVQAAAIRSLARIGDKGVSRLIRLLRRGTVEQRLLAVTALAGTATKRAAKGLRRAARSGPPVIRLNAAKALRTSSPRLACGTLRRLAHRRYPIGTRLQAIEALSECGDSEAQRLLTDLARHPQARLRRAARSALGMERWK